MDNTAVIATISTALLLVSFVYNVVSNHNEKTNRQRSRDDEQNSEIRALRESNRGAWDLLNRVVDEVRELRAQVKELEMSGIANDLEIRQLTKSTEKAEAAIKELVAVIGKISGALDD